MIKKLISTMLCGLLFISAAVPAFAAEESPSVEIGEKDITVVQSFETTETEKFNYSFEKKIEKDGKKYELKGVNYRVIDSKPLDEALPITHKVDYKDLYTKQANAPETLTITQKGEAVDVKLKNVEYEETTITNRTETVSAYTDFDYKTVTPNPPKTKTVTYHDNGSQKDVQVTLDFKELKAEDDWKWINDVEIPMTFSLYDSAYYVLGDKYIPYNDEKPALQGHENDILKELKLDSQKYRITSVEWNGEPYMVGDVMYRKAVAHGERYAANYVAYYESNVSLPDAAGYNAVALYEGEGTTLSGRTQYTVEATAVYSPDYTTQAIVAGVVGGLILIALLVIAVLYIISKKQEKKN